jgi:negative regulator of flagellin synthesis FlgM
MVDPVAQGPVSRARIASAATGPSPRAMTAGHQTARKEAASLPRLVTLAAELASQGPPVDYARIAQVRQAIADGSYTVDPDRIAQSILAFHAEGDA